MFEHRPPACSFPSGTLIYCKVIVFENTRSAVVVVFSVVSRVVPVCSAVDEVTVFSTCEVVNSTVVLVSPDDAVDPVCINGVVVNSLSVEPFVVAEV